MVINTQLLEGIASATDLTLGDKLIISVFKANPRWSKRSIAQRLGTSERTVHRAIEKAKKYATGVIQYDTRGVECDTGVIQCDARVIQYDTGGAEYDARVIRNSSSSNKEEKEKPERKTPTKDEVTKFAYQMKRPDLAEEFFDHYEENDWVHNNTPLIHWRAMFRGWARRTPIATEPANGSYHSKGRLSAEEARFQQDNSY